LVSPKSHFFEDKNLLPREFLKAAEATKDSHVFYSTYKFFEQRNLILRNDRKFEINDGCDEYVKEFEKLFGTRQARKDSFYHYDDDDEYVESGDDEDEKGISKDDEKYEKEKSVSSTSAPHSPSGKKGEETPSFSRTESDSTKGEQPKVGGTGENVTIPDDLADEDGSPEEMAL